MSANQQLSFLAIGIVPDRIKRITEHISRHFDTEASVETAADLQGALAWLTQKNIDVILLCLDGDGLEPLESVSALRRENPHVPVVVVLSDPNDDLAVRLLAAGAGEVLTSEQLESDDLQRVVRFIHARQMAIADLAVREAEHRQIIDNARHRVFETDLDYYIVSWNKYASEHMGKSEWELKPGFNMLDFLAFEDRKRILEHTKRLFLGERLDAIEYMAKNKDGEHFPVLMELSPIFGESRPAGIRMVVLDVSARTLASTERSSLEERLRQSRKLEALGLMASGVAHDINNVLSVISVLAASVSKDLTPDDRLKRNLESIVTSAKSGGELLQKLLRFARHESECDERFSVNNQVREVEFLLNHMVPESTEINLDLETQPTFVSGNPSQINHSLINVCVNALNAMNGGGVLSLMTKREEISDETQLPSDGLKIGSYITIRIVDTGTGMDQETIDHAFEPFFTTKPAGEGTGLGLSMVADTVSRHGGAVDITSKKDHGTSVIIYLPADDRTSWSVTGNDTVTDREDISIATA